MNQRCMSNAPVEKESSTATLIWQDGSTIFRCTAVLISVGGKKKRKKQNKQQPGKLRLWPRTKAHFVRLLVPQVERSTRRVQGSGNERLKKSGEWSGMRKRRGDGPGWTSTLEKQVLHKDLDRIRYVPNRWLFSMSELLWFKRRSESNYKPRVYGLIQARWEKRKGDWRKMEIQNSPLI